MKNATYNNEAKAQDLGSTPWRKVQADYDPLHGIVSVEVKGQSHFDTGIVSLNLEELEALVAFYQSHVVVEPCNIYRDEASPDTWGFCDVHQKWCGGYDTKGAEYNRLKEETRQRLLVQCGGALVEDDQAKLDDFADAEIAKGYNNPDCLDSTEDFPGDDQ